MMDMLFGFAEMGMGVVTGVIAAGSKGAFKFGEKSAIKSVEGGEKERKVFVALVRTSLKFRLKVN